MLSASPLEVILYVFAVNFITYGVFFLDKRAAQQRQPRVPEKALLLLSLAGGSAGAYYAMRRFRHKTKKSSFRALFGLVVVVQVLAFTGWIFGVWR
jgi:uncharacterized membrane protein YsdA (DUF1294 family)